MFIAGTPIASAPNASTGYVPAVVSRCIAVSIAAHTFSCSASHADISAAYSVSYSAAAAVSVVPNAAYDVTETNLDIGMSKTFVDLAATASTAGILCSYTICDEDIEYE